jgi:Flp pilus assembly pilin Flp
MSGREATGFRQQTDRLYVRLRALAVAFVCDEHGQDLIEYALLTATIGVAGAAVWAAMGPAIAAAYTTWGTGVNNQWETPDPGAGS